MSSDTKPALRIEELRNLCDAASPGPWFYDSYSRVYSAPLCKLYREWHARAIPPGALDDPAFDWEAAAASEPKTMVCSVPCRAGDTATEQGARDADFIEAARTAVPDLIAELERLAAENAALKLTLDGRDKAIELWRSGMDSTCQDRDRLKQQARALEAELADLKVAREWRDIATAPKDGKRIILFGTVLSYTCSRDSRGKPLGSPGVVVGYWDTDRWGSGVYEIVPTRWMPMPQPPEPPTEDK